MSRLPLFLVLCAALLRALALPGWLGWALILPALALRLEGWNRGGGWRADLAGGFFFWALAFSFLGHVHPVMPIGAALVMCPFWVLEGWVARRLRSRIAASLAGVLAIAAMEWVRTLFPMGGIPGASLGLGAADGFLLPLGVVSGEAGVGLLILFGVGACLGWARKEGKFALLPFGALLLLHLASLSFTHLPQGGPSLSCLAVQANLTLEEKHGALPASEVFARHAALTEEGLAQHPDTQLVIWAETMWPWPGVEPWDSGIMRRPWPGRPPEELPIQTLARLQIAQVAALLEGHPSTRLLAGAHFYRGIPESSPTEIMSPRTSEVMLFDAGGLLVDRSGKQELVPFGESLPFGGAFPGARSLAMRVFAATGLLPDFDRPPYAGPLTTGRSPHLLGVAVCWENMFAEVFRRQALDGAQAFIVQSNEAWYATGAEMDQMVASTRWRAVETGRPVLRVTNTGVTLLVGRNGSIRDFLPRGESGVLFTNLPCRPLGAPLPPFAIWGWLLSPAIALLALILSLTPFQVMARFSLQREGNPPVRAS